MKKFLGQLLAGSVVFATAFVLTEQPGYAAGSIAHQINLPAGQSWCDDTMINGLFEQVNALRSQRGVTALNMNSLGMKDAEIRASQFAAYMAVTSLYTPGFNPHQGYDTTAASLGYNLVGENLAYLTSDPWYIVYGVWQDSLHLAAMLSDKANVAGVSCVYLNGIPFWTYEPGFAQASSTPAPAPTQPASPAPAPSSSGTTSSGNTSSGTASLESEEAAFLVLINNYRAQNGVGPLEISAMLQNSAKWMSNDMAAKNYVSHTDSLGRSPGVRFASFGYTYYPWGENIAAGYGDAQNTLNQWVTACDPDAAGNCTYAHRKNMLESSFKAIGIGRASGSGYGWYWTTDFGGYVDQAVSPTPTPAPVPAPVPQPAPTPAPTPAPSISSFAANPTSVAPGQVTTLSWTVSGASSVRIDNGVGDVSTVSLKSISPSQTTTYRLTATNSVGSTTAAVTVVVNVPGPDLQPPSTPVITSAAAKASNEVSFAWSASSDNIGVVGYQLIRNGSIFVSVAGGTLSYTDTAVSASSTYFYAVRAFDAAGNYSNLSNAVQVTTSAAPAATAGNCAAPVSEAFTGCYYNNINLAGNPVLSRTDPEINFDWGPNSPLSSYAYSVRWQGYFNFDDGAYNFYATSSDGMRIYIDGDLILDRWRDQPAYMYRIRRNLGSGRHLVTVEYYEQTGLGTAHLTWQKN